MVVWEALNAESVPIAVVIQMCFHKPFSDSHLAKKTPAVDQFQMMFLINIDGIENVSVD
jgi:hypothetical protein